MVQNLSASLAAPDGRRKARPTAALASSNQLLDTLQTQLRSQSVRIDHLEAENAEQRAVSKTLRLEVARLQIIQRTDAQDLVHLAGKLLTLTQVVGVELDNATKALFRRHGWTATARKNKAQKQ